MAVNGADTIWTDDLISVLIKMHGQGASFIAIGEAIGVSKNSCIGKARRLGLMLRRQPNGSPRKPRAKRVKTENPSGKREKVLRIVRAGYGNGMRVASSTATEMPVFSCIELAPLNKTLIELGANDCKYIAGDPREAAAYCGHPVFKRSYCEGHFNRCYIEPEKRWGAPSSPGYHTSASGGANHLEVAA